MSLQLLPGLVSGSPRWSTIGSDGWLLNIIILRSWFLAGLSTDRAAAEALRQPMNFLTLLSVGLVIQIHARNGVGEGREISEARRASSNLNGSGWLGAPPKSTWSTRSTAK